MTTTSPQPARPRRSAAWGYQAPGEPRWPASVAVIVALLLYITLPKHLVLGPVWLIPLLELALLLPLSIVSPRRVFGEPNWQRVMAIVLIAVLNIANVLSLILLVRLLLFHPAKVSGIALLTGALQLWLTNIIVYALWYWELDRGGPDEREGTRHREPDFLFPQMGTPGCTRPEWAPKFVDYVYVAFVDATAFSPGDTMPLTPWAKMLMAAQAIVSLLIIALVASRAVGILS